MVISDFYDPKGFEAGINTLRYNKFEPFVLQVYDKREAEKREREAQKIADARERQAREAEALKAQAERERLAQQRAASDLARARSNDAYIGSDEDDPESYYPGKLAAEGAAEAIVLTLSGPAMPTWCLTQRYTRSASGIEFGKVSEDRGTQMSLLEGWATENPQIN